MMPIAYLLVALAMVLFSVFAEISAMQASLGGFCATGLLTVYHFAQVRRLQKQVAKLTGEAETDPLTGALNRRAGMQRLKGEQARAQRYGRPSWALLSVDVDHFKAVNDSFGHPAGDEVLKTVADVLRQVSRTTDSVIRCGGEEFWVLLPETSLAMAKAHADRLRAKLQRMVQVRGQQAIPITASIGVAASGKEEDLSLVICRSDSALYSAKRNGRNCVCVN